ncbi:MAG TPA: efflux RND transporter permease subunit [Gemmatimonadaceae bacterium]|nr:efflux RND transporter permease subunit [Gemmatimonadaceae bacterium]
MNDAPKQARRRSALPSWAIRRPIGTLALTSVMLVLGAMFVSRLPLDLLPRIIYPQIRVGVNNPGVEPGVMEETIAKPLEAALSTTEDLVRLEAEIQEGRVGINLHFRYGTDIDVALQEASTNLDRARSRLPEEADPPTIWKSDPSQIPVYEAGFSSPTRDLIALRSWIEDRLRPQLLTIEGVASVDVSGGLIREIQVVLDQERMQSYGISVSEIISAIRAQNQDIAAGRIASGDRELVGKTAGKFRSVNDIRAVLVDVGGGRRVPLSEFAIIRDTHQEQRLWARLDGVPAVKVSIRKQPDANTVRVADEVNKRMASLSASGFVPRDVEYRVIQNQAAFIRNSVNSVRNAAMLGAVLAMIVVLLFLQSLRKTIVIGLAIPFAILSTFVLMGLGDLTLNIMSLGGLALGVGMLLDNSIVMLENIFRKRDEEGIEDPVEAAHAGAGEVSSAVVAATSTNLAAVVPFLLVTGLSALIFRELILTISFAILASLTVALTLVPMLSAQLAKIRFTSHLSETRFMRGFDHGVDRMRRGYRRAAPSVLRWRWAVLGTSIAILFLATRLTSTLGNEFLPQVDDGGVGVGLSLPPGSTPEQTNALALEIERMVRAMPDVQSVFATAGGFLFGGSTADRSGRGSLDIRLVPLSERTMTADTWVRSLQTQIDERGFPGARVFVRPPRIRGLRTSFSGSDISISVQGDELPVLQRIAAEITQSVKGVPGLENLEASAEDASPQISIRLDRERAGFLGLNVAQVGQTLRTALDGTIATRFAEGNREYDVRVMLPRDKFTSPEQLASVALFPGGVGRSPIYLRDVADVATSLGPTEIRRENQNRVLRLNGDVITEVASVSVVNDSIRTRLASLELPEGYGLIYGGEEEAIRENNRQLTIVVLLAVFLVFVVLALQYESLVNPLVILVTIPLSLIGVGIGLWVTATPLSAPVLLGVILLAGIVVNNAILLVEYVEEYRRDHNEPMDRALVLAGSVRLRPILMTTITTMLGMLPLALGLGQGSELMRPLAIAVVSGMLISMLLTLFVVPCAYMIMHTGAERLQTFLLGQREPHRVGKPEPSAGD